MKGSVTRRKPSLALNVVAVVVAINVAGAAVYVLTRHKNTSEQASGGGGDTAAAPGEPTGDVSRALRAAGLAALESGRYEEAVKRFTEAAKSSKASADLPQLMKIAMELRDRSSTAPTKGVTTTDMAANAGAAEKADEKQPDEAKPDDTKEPEDKPTVAANGREDAKTAAKRREREREAAAREREREKQRRQAAASSSRKPEPADVETAPAAVAPGTIIVSSTPSGLTVQLDGKAMDQTPLRLSAEPGSHEIALLHNNTVVFSRRLNVVSSSVQSLDPDVSAQVALLTPSRPEPVAAAATTQTTQAAAKDPASTGLTTPKQDDKPDQRGNTGDTQEKPRNDLDPNALYAIANSSVGLSSVSAEQLADVYFGRSSTLNGRKVEPILRSPSGGAGAAFFRSVLRTNTRSYRESWQKLELAGKATPPPILSNASDVWRAVAGRSGAISFALGSELNGNATNLRPIRISY